ncbi:MAG: copper resistance protein CopC [Acidimicrobiia bacterium]|nr:copper resistance protein CopC [Acidimicrobiia bacterium]
MAPPPGVSQAATDPRVELLGPDGERIPRDLTTPDEYSVILAFNALTDTGNYQLRWFAQAADDHPITGAATFSISEETKPGARKPPGILLLVLGSIGVAAAVGFAICATWQRSR